LIQLIIDRLENAVTQRHFPDGHLQRAFVALSHSITVKQRKDISITDIYEVVFKQHNLSRGVDRLKILESQVSSSPLAEDLGGIDMNNIPVDRAGGRIEIQFDPVQIEHIIEQGVSGFSPVIVNFVPLPSVLPLLGLKPREDEEFELSQLN